ncbi:chemotaxis protein CheD [Thalassococcus sp. CAU 1522]|uniref:Probable chemoreceptor glutamine deamidase CheD n=1 Tax=Thalassococcus arenae TaxID=2851652 RepID=A0ABS6N3L4_9RHOB|nr:chemotaxis protein CheD [Thalassococcus arenae]MBV2358615.1 chemotaxis protein CheD [Thalassococcus arenae]
MMDDMQQVRTIIQGEFAVSSCADQVFATVLGSCVAVCLTDPSRGIGGMNHFLLPGRRATDGHDIRYGAYLMELLINGLLKAGACKRDMRAKVFGGAWMGATPTDIGAGNVAFAQEFLASEGIPILSSSVGGTKGRKIRFWPGTGRAQQSLLGDASGLAVTEVPTRHKAAASVTLF